MAKAKVKNLNAPKKITWMISFFAAIAGVILGIVGFTGTAWATVASFVALLVSSALMLLSNYLKGL